MAELALTAAAVRPDGRLVELTFSGPLTAPAALPDASAADHDGLRLTASNGSTLEPLGAVATAAGGTLTWTATFLVTDPAQVITRDDGAVRLSGAARLFDDGAGNWTGRVDAQAANLSLVDADGFTTDSFRRGTGGVTLYVSSRHGNDQRTLASAQDPATPLRSVQRAFALLSAAGQHGRGAAVRLLRGDTFAGHVRVTVGGQDRDHPLVIEDYWHDYGDGRPDPGTRPVVQSDLRLGQLNGLWVSGGAGHPVPHHVVVRRVHFAQTGRSEGDSAGTGLSLLLPVRDWTIDDSVFENFANGGNFWAGSGRLTDVTLLRTAILDSHKNTANTSPGDGIGTQGLLANHTDRLLISQSTFDRNGRTTSDLSGRSVYSHNLYINKSNGPAAVWGSIIRAGGSHGVQLRSGGILAYNYFARNAIGGFVGHPGGVATRNVVELAEDIDPLQRRGWGLGIEATQTNILSAALERNIVVNALGGNALGLYTAQSNGVGIRDAVIRNNTLVHAGHIEHSLSSKAAPHAVRAESNLVDSDGRPGVVVRSSTSNWGWYESDENLWHNDVNRPFSRGGALIGWDDWQRLTGTEDRSIDAVPGLVDGGAGIAGFAAARGLGATEAQFIAHARSRRPGTWGSADDALQIYEYFADRYRPTNLGATASGDHYGAVDYLDAVPEDPPEPPPVGALAAPDLNDAQDTGASASDNITRTNSYLMFLASGTERGAIVELRRDGVVVGTRAGGDDRLWLADPSRLPDGAYRYTFRQILTDGRWADSPATLVTIDREPPEKPAKPLLLTPSSGRTAGNALEFHVEADDPAARVTLHRRPRGVSAAYEAVASRFGPGTVVDPGADAGTYDYATVRYDLAGNHRFSDPTIVTIGPAA
jgi:hypothetical protein